MYNFTWTNMPEQQLNLAGQGDSYLQDNILQLYGSIRDTALKLYNVYLRTAHGNFTTMPDCIDPHEYESVARWR